MKKNFETPEVELEKFQVEDVLTTSNPTQDNAGIQDDLNPGDIELGI